MEQDRKPNFSHSPESLNRRDAYGIGEIEWTPGRARSDIAGDPEMWLATVGFAGDIPIASAKAFRNYVENWMMSDGTIIEADGALIHESYTERYVFPVVGMADSAPVYAIAGYGNFER